MLTGTMDRDFTVHSFPLKVCSKTKQTMSMFICSHVGNAIAAEKT
jgi:hypothetical protein